MDLMNSSNEIQHRIMKYFLDKLDRYTRKSHLWQLMHAPHIHRNLLKKSRHLSKIHSISEDLVRQCFNQLLNDVDQYVTELYQILSSENLHQKISAFHHPSKPSNLFQKFQMERAKQFFPQLTDRDLFDEYYRYCDEKYTPSKKNFNPSSNEKNEIPFDLHSVYSQSEGKAKEFLRTFFDHCPSKSKPNLNLIDQMIKLGMFNHSLLYDDSFFFLFIEGMTEMRKLPSKEDFQDRNSFLGRFAIFNRTKDAYQSILKNTSEDFLIIRFGRLLGRTAPSNSNALNERFRSMLHEYLKSILKFFILISTNENEWILSSIGKFSDLFSFDEDGSMKKRFPYSIFSPESNIDQWTWLMEQWRNVLRTMPFILTENGAFSRVIRTTIGISLMHLGDLAEKSIENESIMEHWNEEYLNKEMFEYLQIGFYFGLAYAVVDCLQDEIHHFDRTSLKEFFLFKDNEKSCSTLSETIDCWLEKMEEFLIGKDFHRNDFPSTPFTTMLIETFDYLFVLTEKNPNQRSISFHQLALLLRSQRFDQKSFDENYTDEQLYLGSVLKSHYTYRCAAQLGQMSSALNCEDHRWIIPFLGQLTDDCRDFPSDMKSHSVTPFTYFAHLSPEKQKERRDLNPLNVFFNICSEIYRRSSFDDQTGAFLGRRILRALRSIHLHGGEQFYRKFLQTFTSDNPSLHHYCSEKFPRLFFNVTDPEKTFFRRLDQMSIHFSRTNRKLETYIFETSPLIENALTISSISSQQLSLKDEEILLRAMNYSVKAGGKRLRMFLVLILGELYGISNERILPLACAIEYLHTSSLIFDDLPAQDNSDLRRGRSTLHKTTINNDITENLAEARAQLAGVDLISVSMHLINQGLIENGFSPEKITRVIGEIAQLMHSLCVGQMMDLRAAKMGMNDIQGQVEELDRIAWFKTGKTIEAVLIAPALLSPLFNEKKHFDQELIRLRELSRFMGILFQMKDDLLDLESTDLIGKPSALDLKNHTVTYLSILGEEQLRQRLNLFLKQTLHLVELLWPNNAETVQDVIRHLVNRKS